MSREKRSRKSVRATLVTLDGVAARRPLALALSDAMRAEEGLGPGERRATALGSRAVVRHLRQLDTAIAQALQTVGLKPKSVTGEDRSMLRYLALRLLLESDAPERVLAELALPGPRRPRSMDDLLLKRVAMALPKLDSLAAPSDPISAISFRQNVPEFLARRLAADVGPERAEAVLQALNVESRFDLRANRLLTERETLAGALAKAGVETRPCRYAPDGLVASDRAHLFGPLHEAGHFELQDEGSQLLALLTGAKPGETAIDFCAGSGGKSLALAAMVGATGKVIAADAVERRLAELPARARRAKAQKIVQADGAKPDEKWVSKADVVLVDAPCSGIGSLRREPDLRWRTNEETLDSFPPQQLEILRDAATFVRPGGRLVYATCSPFRVENEAVVEAFLADAPFKLLDAKKVDPRLAELTEKKFLRCWPDRHDTGAFFGAVMTTKAAR